MKLSGETLNLISYICFAIGGVFGIITVLLFVIPHFRNKNENGQNIASAEENGSTQADVFSDQSGWRTE